MATTIDVYLCAGQSNMSGFGQVGDLPEVLQQPHPTALMYWAPLDEGRQSQPLNRQWNLLQPGVGWIPESFGPELSFGHTVAASSDQRIAILKCEQGGTGIYNDWRPHDLDDATSLTNRAIADCREALDDIIAEGHTPRLRGILWFQGETDADDVNPEPILHMERLHLLIERFRNELAGGERVPFVLFRVNPTDPHHKNAEIVRGAIQAVADADPAGAWVDIDNLSLRDNIHLDSSALLAAGDRAAKALASLPQPAIASDVPTAPVEAGTQHDAEAPADEVATAPSDASEELPEPMPEPPAAEEPTPTPNPAAKIDIPLPESPRIIALMNQKGGVGKTTTAVNVAAGLALAGAKVLVMDLDPQAHLSLSLGIDPHEIDASMYDLLTDDSVMPEDILQTAADSDNLHVLPAEVNLAGVEAELADRVMTGTAQTVLKTKCAKLIQDYHYVILDCPPSLGLLTINGLTLASEVVVPMQAHFLALQGLGKLCETLNMLRQGINPTLTMSGVVLCMHEKQTLLAGEVISELNSFFEQARGTEVPWSEAVVFQPPIRRNIKLAEAPSFGQSVHAYDAQCHGSKDYLKLAQHIAS